jgi:dTMP kinase
MTNAVESKPGMVVVLEGCDGSGKTTIAKHVVDTLLKYGIEPLLYRGPGGTQFGEKMRSAMFGDSDVEPCNDALIHAMMASHAQLTHEVLIPNKKAGKLIICDRYVESTLSYQGLTPQLQHSIDLMINSLVPVGLIDRTYVVDIPIDIAMTRIRARGVENFLDTRPIEFYAGIRDRLLSRSFELRRRGQMVELIDNNVFFEQTKSKAHDIATSILSAYINR